MFSNVSNNLDLLFLLLFAAENVDAEKQEDEDQRQFANGTVSLIPYLYLTINVECAYFSAESAKLLFESAIFFHDSAETDRIYKTLVQLHRFF